MYFFFIGLFLVAFQVTCLGAPERLLPVPHLPVDVPRGEKHVEKRAYSVVCGNRLDSKEWHQEVTEVVQKHNVCTDDQLDKSSVCSQWAAAGRCDQSSRYYLFMQMRCYASCGNCEVPPTPVPQVDEDACLQAHNTKRALHQDTPALVWDASLAEHAKAWADHLAATRTLYREQRPGEGENLYRVSSSSVKTCSDAVEFWYSEIKDYDYKNPGSSSPTGRFTQLVWKGTNRVGVGLKKIVTSDGFTMTYVVARYSPPGNIDGQYADNVKPLQTTS